MSWLDRYFTSRNYGTIQGDGTNLPPQPIFNFLGTGVVVANDSSNTRTNITVTAGASPAGIDGDLQAKSGTGFVGITPPAGSLVGTTATQTLTGKTLTSPIIGGSPDITATTQLYSGEPYSIERDIQIASVVTTDATPTNLYTFATTTGRSYYLSGFIEGTSTSLATRQLYRVEQWYDNNGGTLTARISSPTGGITELIETSSSATLVADASGTTIRVRITAIAATTIRWRGRLFLHEGLP